MDFKYKIADVAKEFGMPAKKVVETVSGVTGVLHMGRPKPIRPPARLRKKSSTSCWRP